MFIGSVVAVVIENKAENRQAVAKNLVHVVAVEVAAIGEGLIPEIGTHNVIHNVIHSGMHNVIHSVMHNVIHSGIHSGIYNVIHVNTVVEDKDRCHFMKNIHTTTVMCIESFLEIISSFLNEVLCVNLLSTIAS